MLPAQAPAAVAKRLRDTAIRVVGLPDVLEAMARQGLEVETSSPQELAARIKAETAVWAGVIKDAGIRPE
jgi:tripartite-type tricarboxylate transporter receptor subunit TctC